MKITPKLFEVAGSPKKMALLEVEEIRQIIREIGLAPTKQRIFAEWQSRFSKTEEK